MVTVKPPRQPMNSKDARGTLHDCVDFTRYEGARHPQQGMTAAEVEEQHYQRKTWIENQGIHMVEITRM